MFEPKEIKIRPPNKKLIQELDAIAEYEQRTRSMQGAIIIDDYIYLYSKKIDIDRDELINFLKFQTEMRNRRGYCLGGESGGGFIDIIWGILGFLLKPILWIIEKFQRPRS